MRQYDMNKGSMSKLFEKVGFKNRWGFGLLWKIRRIPIPLPVDSLFSIKQEISAEKRE